MNQLLITKMTYQQHSPPDSSEQESPSGDSPQPRPPRFWLRSLLILTLLVAGGGIAYGWYFIYYRLSPTVAESLSKLLSRPVEIGEVEAVSFSSLRFGESVIPPTEDTPETATVSAIEVDFTLFQLFTQQTLELDVTLIKPDIQVKQTVTGEWITTELTEQPPGFLEIKLNTLDAEDANIALSPRNEAGNLQSPVKFTLPEFNSEFLEDNQRIPFQLNNLSVVNGEGNVDIKGESRPEAGEVDLKVTTDQLAIGELARLVTSPVDILAGTLALDAEVNLSLDGNLPTFQGTANLNSVTAKVEQLSQPFTNTNAEIRLAEQDIIFEEFTTKLGDVSAIAQGKINLETGYDLNAEIQPTAIANLLKAADLEASEIPISGKVKANIAITGGLENPQFDITAESTESTKIDQINLQRFQSKVSVNGNNLAIENFQATPQTGGEISAQGKVNLTEAQTVDLDVQLKDISGEMIRPYQPDLPSDLGILNASGEITGSFNDWKNLEVDGTANLDIAAGSVSIPKLNLSDARLQAQLNLNQLKPEKLSNQVPPQFQEPVSGKFNLDANLADFSPEKLRLTGQGELNVPNGNLAATEITFQDGQLNANLNLTDIPLALIAPETPPQLQNELLSAQFQVRADVGEFDLNKIQGTGSGSITIDGSSSAQVSLENLRLNQGNWQGDVDVNNLKIAQFVSDLPSQLDNALISTQLSLQGTLAEVSPQNINVQGRGEISQISGGSITANVIRLQDGNFNLVATPKNISLSQLSDQLQGSVGGEVIVEGNLENLTPAGITAQGNLNFPQGLSVIENPLTARLRWTGQEVLIEEAEAENFFAEGTIALNLNQQGTEIVKQINLTVDAEQLDLSRLPLPTSEAVGKIDVQGFANIAGNITGTPTQPQAQGEILLQNFAVERFVFDPQMTGSVQVNPEQGVNLDLTGNTETPDRIQLALSSPQADNLLPLTPQSFLVKRDRAVAEGNREGDALAINIQNVPLDLLKEFAPLPPEFAQQPASGELIADLTLSLNNYAVRGEIALDNPSLGRFNSDRASLNFTYLDNLFTVSQATLIQQESEYRASGRVNFSDPTPDFQANLNIQQGRIQDIVDALQVFDISDFQENFTTPNYGDANDLDVASINIENQPLETQLRRFSEIQALLAQLHLEKNGTTVIPPLAAAEGNFTGNVNVEGSSFNLEDIIGEFRLAGEAWQWGPYEAQTVTAEGSLNNGIITLLPIRLASGDSFVNLSGTFGGENQSAQLQVNQIPIALLQQIIELPEFIGVSGFVNGTATVAGTPNNPTARGELTVAEATLNETPVNSIEGSFSYNNSQLNFFAEGLLTADSDPLTLVGDLPYQLPFVEIPPPSENLNIEISLQDEGFKLLDVISDGQLKWQGGKGNVNLAISGPFQPENFQFEQLTAEGSVTLANAKIATATLPQPLTDIDGRIEFNFNQLNIQQLNASLGGGDITATGGLALFNRNVVPEKTIDIDLQNIALNLPDLYQGDISGNLNIGRTAIEPEIRGDITAANGEVILAATETQASPEESDMSNIGFSNLDIILGENVKVVRQPILNFLANGSLTLNGTLANLRPQGTINLQRGRVNLGTTQFRLAKGYEQTATFIPFQGFDPTLNLRLVTSVAETSGNLYDDPATVGFNKGINTTPGTLQSVEVAALVQGRASELQPRQLAADRNIITLSSDPNRSETEILALLGGGLTNGLGQGNTAFGLANLASSALLSPFQNTISDALGLSEFRIFPTLIPTETEDGEESSDSTLGFGAEAGVEISDQFSLSVLTIFNADQTFQYSARYRLSDHILLRGSTDLSDNDSLTVEYESRF